MGLINLSIVDHLRHCGYQEVRIVDPKMLFLRRDRPVKEEEIHAIRKQRLANETPRIQATSSQQDGGNKGGCPVNHQKVETPSDAGAGKCPVNHQQMNKAEGDGAAKCPVNHGSKNPFTWNAANNMENFDSGDGKSVADVKPTVPLSSQREESSIPKGDFSPAHQQDTEGKNLSERWMYPSEQMYFNAMLKKGWNPDAKDMKSIVNIHNAVNEQGWSQVLQYEKLHWQRKHANDSENTEFKPPTLVKFQGRPTEMSPKARILTTLMGYTEPFDRHDWFVDRNDGSEPVRYVIDFYTGKSMLGDALPSVYLDTRPAVDSVDSVVDRIHMQFNDRILPFLPFQGAFLNRTNVMSDSKISGTSTASRAVEDTAIPSSK